MRVPAVLIPYPTASDNHQFHNARAFEATGAARLLEQKVATPELLIQMLSDLIEKPVVRERLQDALSQWHAPHAAEQIAEVILAAMEAGAGLGVAGARIAGPGDQPKVSQAGPWRAGRSASRTALPAGRGV
jgi:UDP:flavonoid glycosyltransferase YjiC (YdhE family)